MINPHDSINEITRSLIASGRFTEKEASEIAVQAKVGYSNFQGFEESRRHNSNKEIYLAARQLGFI